MPLLETKGAASAQGFGLTLGGAAPVYIEDVFSTWLYTGNGSTQTITNGIDLSTKGGLVWIKSRSTATDNALFDTARGASNGFLSSNTTDTPYASPSSDLTSFGASGFSITNSTGNVNVSSSTYASWTFREQPKFFDVVTYTGNGSTQNIAHSLGSTPGCIIVKRTNTTGSWRVFHRSVSTQYGNLNSTAAFQTTSAENVWGNNSTTVAPTSTQFTVGNDSSVNASGSTYVAYLFAHDAGGFGLTGTDNVISCGSFTAAGSTTDVTVNLGYEPQWLLVKVASTNDDWYIYDVMRGMSYTSTTYLRPSSSGAEVTFTTPYGPQPTATGFIAKNSLGWSAGETLIYIAIRRGPMKTPTTGTSVFKPTVTAANLGVKITTGFVTDLQMANYTAGDSQNTNFADRLRGIANTNVGNPTLASSSTRAENTSVNYLYAADNTGWLQGGWSANATSVRYDFCRAPGFFDVVCYTGNNVYQQAQSHNLGVAPELIIVKRRDSTANWAVGCNFTNTEFQYLNLNSGADGGNTNAYTTGGFFGGRPTATTFILAQNSITNASGGTYVAYLFATLAGVSKVGTYTGTGALQTINCGFTSGARFVLIKRLGDNVDPGTGDWFVYDSARGISSGNDPYLLLNSTAAEVTSTNYVDTASTGFQVTAAAPAALNASGGTYIFLAIA